MFLELCFTAFLHSAGVERAQTAPSPSAPAKSAQTAEPREESAGPSQPEVSIEDEVLANLQGMDMGPVKLESLALPQEYLRRVADRIIQSSFEDRFRIVVPDPKPDGTDPDAPATNAGAASSQRKLWSQIAGAVVGALCVWVGITFARRRQTGAR